MRRRIALVWWACLLLLQSACKSHEPTGAPAAFHTALFGVVVDQDDQLVAGATVSIMIYGLTANEPLIVDYQIVTDSAGEFNWTLASADSYNGWFPVTVHVEPPSESGLVPSTVTDSVRYVLTSRTPSDTTWLRVVLGPGSGSG